MRRLVLAIIYHNDLLLEQKSVITPNQTRQMSCTSLCSFLVYNTLYGNNCGVTIACWWMTSSC